jgi:DNA-binding beta-propeller fold protein YncE
VVLLLRRRSPPATLRPTTLAISTSPTMTTNGSARVDKDGIIHPIAGSGKKGYSGDGSPATEAALNGPSGIDFDGEGSLFITCHYESAVRKVDENGTITTVAGTSDEAGGIVGFNREKGPATEVWLNQPIGLFVDDDAGVLYIADSSNTRVRALRLEDLLS